MTDINPVVAKKIASIQLTGQWQILIELLLKKLHPSTQKKVVFFFIFHELIALKKVEVSNIPTWFELNLYDEGWGVTNILHDLNWIYDELITLKRPDVSQIYLQYLNSCDESITLKRVETNRIWIFIMDSSKEGWDVTNVPTRFERTYKIWTDQIKIKPHTDKFSWTDKIKIKPHIIVLQTDLLSWDYQNSIL